MSNIRFSYVINLVCKDCEAWFPVRSDSNHIKNCLDCGGELYED